MDRRRGRTRLRVMVGAMCALLIGVADLEAQRGAGGARGGGERSGGPGRGGAGRGAPRPDQEMPQPTFSTRVTVVQIDAIVTDAAGHPVANLTADDFEILEAGEPRPVVALNAVDIPLPSPTPATVVGAEPDAVSNTGPPGRTYLIALDEVAPEQALRARAMLRHFIETSLGPHDVAGVALTGRGLATSGQDFTRNTRLLLGAIDRFSGGFDEATPGRPSASSAPQLAASLRTLTEFLAGIPGRKVLVLVAEGLDGLDAYAATDYHGGALSPAQRDIHAAIAAATRGNVTIYPVDPRGLTLDMTAAESFDPVALETRSDLAALADVTGGFAVVGTNNISDALQRLVRENSSYYTLGFASGYDRMDGRFVPVQVRVRRPGLQVRARNGYVAPLERSRTASEIRTDARNPHVVNAIGSPIAVSTVPMRVAAASYRSGRNASVVLTMEFDASALDLVERDGRRVGELELSYLATDASGRVRPGRRHSAEITVPAGAAGVESAGRWVRAVSEFELQRGRYQLRVAAGSGSRAGSVVYDLDIPDFGDGPLALSHVSLTTSAAAALRTLHLRDPLRRALPGPPVAIREFSTEESIAVYTEVYRNGRRDELPELVVDLRGPDGRRVRTASEQMTSEPIGGGQGGRGVTSSLRLSGLAPGAYVLHVEARLPGSGDAARRTIPVSIREGP